MTIQPVSKPGTASFKAQQARAQRFQSAQFKAADPTSVKEDGRKLKRMNREKKARRRQN